MTTEPVDLDRADPGPVPDEGPPPVTVLSGHIVIYDDTAAGRGHVITFRDDGSGDLIMPALPGMVIPLLAKVLGGHELTAADLPSGIGKLGMLKGVLGNGNSPG
jgi:hypothetical protein